jgi:hypothetical protein
MRDSAYDPPHRGWLPAQDRWPSATPESGWPAAGFGSVAGTGRGRHRAGREAVPVAAGYQFRGAPVAVGYPAQGFEAQGFPAQGFPAQGFPAQAGYAGRGYADLAAASPAGYPGQQYAEPGYPGQGAYLGEVDSSDWGIDWDGYVYRDPGDDVEDVPAPGIAREPGPAGPDAVVVPGRHGTDGERRRETVRLGPLAGTVAGLLAVGVLAGVSALTARFIGPQASPVSALVRLAQTPQPFRHLGWAVLATIAVVVAICVGNLSRRSVLPGVAGLTGVSLLAGFTVIIRPHTHAIDVVPTAAGGVAAIADFLWVTRTATRGRRRQARHSQG